MPPVSWSMSLSKAHFMPAAVRVDPFDDVFALADPDVDDALVALAGRVAGELVQQASLVHMGARCFGVACVDGAEPMAGLLDVAGLLAQREVKAEVRGGRGCGHAAVAGANDEQLRLARLDDVCRVDLGCGAKPVRRVVRGAGLLRRFGGSGVARFGRASGKPERRQGSRRRDSRQEVSAGDARFESGHSSLLCG